MDEYTKPSVYCCGCKVISIKYTNKHKCLLSRCAADLRIMADMLLLEGQNELHFNVPVSYTHLTLPTIYSV